MNEEYSVELEYGNGGLPFIEPIPNSKLVAEKHGNIYTIRGNSEGLLLLAHNLIALAKMQPTPETEGYHIHLDDLYEINNENVEFVLSRSD